MTWGDMHDPWLRLRRLDGWALRWGRLAEGVSGFTDWGSRTIVLDSRLDAAEKRATIAHEVMHAERGPALSDPQSVADEERAAEAHAARMLIPVEALRDLLPVVRDLDAVAAALLVDRALLDARLRGLHPSERGALGRGLPVLRLP